MWLSFQNTGVSVDSEGFFSSEVRMLAVTDLAKLYTISKLSHTHAHALLPCSLIKLSAASRASIILNMAAWPAG